MKRKVRKFKAGGDYESSDDAKNLLAAADREAADSKPAPKATTPAEPMKMASFGEAFKEARGRGDKTFEYMGKKYTTEMAGAKKPAAASTPASKPAESKSSSYADAAKSSRTLGDVIKSDASKQADYRKSIAEGKEKSLGTKLQDFGRRFGRALMTGRPQGNTEEYKKGGSVKSSASKRADGCAMRGKTRGRMV